MSIADEKGTIYEVHQPEELLLSADNDELMAMLKYTYVAKTLNEDFRVLIENGTYSKDEMSENLNEIIIKLTDGVDFLKDYLVTTFSKESVELELLEAKKNMYGKKHGSNN
jgi:hypothetical protein